MLKAYEELRQQAGSASGGWEAVERPPRPLARVSINTSSIAAGANETLEALRREVSERGLAVDVGIVGDTGLSWLEPVVEVRGPDGGHVLYAKVTADNVSKLVDEALAQGGVCRDLAFALAAGPDVEGVPRLDEIDFWNIQERRLLARCGVIDPEQIDHYMANGGYAGLAQALEQDPEAVI